MKTKVAIVGSTGLLGSSTVELLSTTRQVVEVRRSRPTDSTARDIRVADLSDINSLKDVFADAAIILFFPSFSIPSHTPFDARHEISVTTVALTNVIEAAARSDTCPHIVFSSTGGAMYGTSSTPCTEEARAVPESSYALGKLLSEEILRFYARIGRISYTILRFSNLYGSSSERLVPQGAIDTFLDNAIAGRSSFVWTNPEITRDYLFVDDAANAVRVILDDPEKSFNALFNVSSGASASISEVLSLIDEISGGRHKYEYQARYGGVQHIALNSSKFRTLYPNWSNPVSIREGIATAWQRKIAHAGLVGTLLAGAPATKRMTNES